MLLFLISFSLSGCIPQENPMDLPVQDEQPQVETGVNVGDSLEDEKQHSVPNEKLINYVEIQDEIDFFMYSSIGEEIKYYAFDMDKDEKYLIYKSGLSLIQPLSDGTWLAYSNGYYPGYSTKDGYKAYGRKLWKIDLLDESKNEVLIEIIDEENSTSVKMLDDVYVNPNKDKIYYIVDSDIFHEGGDSILYSFDFKNKNIEKIADLETDRIYQRFIIEEETPERKLILRSSAGDGGWSAVGGVEINLEDNTLIKKETIDIDPGSYSETTENDYFSVQENVQGNVIDLKYPKRGGEGELYIIDKNGDKQKIQDISCHDGCSLSYFDYLNSNIICHTDDVDYWLNVKNSNLKEIKGTVSSLLLFKKGVINEGEQKNDKNDISEWKNFKSEELGIEFKYPADEEIKITKTSGQTGKSLYSNVIDNVFSFSARSKDYVKGGIDQMVINNSSGFEYNPESEKYYFLFGSEEYGRRFEIEPLEIILTKGGEEVLLLNEESFVELREVTEGPSVQLKPQKDELVALIKLKYDYSSLVLRNQDINKLTQSEFEEILKTIKFVKN